VSDYRDEQRVAMCYHTRKDRDGLALCHFCEAYPGSQMHELVNRAQTSSNPEALRLSFSEKLCSWLCPRCHEVAPAKWVEAALWRRNFAVYGMQAVLTDFQRVVDALGFTPIVNMPMEAE
jgi:hypothetical protein